MARTHVGVLFFLSGFGLLLFELDVSFFLYLIDAEAIEAKPEAGEESRFSSLEKSRAGDEIFSKVCLSVDSVFGVEWSRVVTDAPKPMTIKTVFPF